MAAESRLPATYEIREFPDAGGPISYGPNFADLFQRAASFVDKILKGAMPADLPVEQPSSFELAINLTTAKMPGISIPAKLLAQANEIVE